MSDLNNLFGFEIKAHRQPRIAEIQFVGYPGAHGVTSMHLGTRGSPFVISGRLSATGSDYNHSRANLDAWIAQLESLLWAEAADYTYRGQTFQNLQFIRLELIPDGQGKVYHFTSTDVLVDFIMHGHILA